MDEINRGDLPRIFGELITTIEYDKRDRRIKLPVTGSSFAVPRNIFLIGTMNTADRSISLMDTALRRRFGFVELMPDSTLLVGRKAGGLLLGAWLDALNTRLRRHLKRDARNLQIGHAYLMPLQPITSVAEFARVLRDDIIPLLEEYCYDDFGMLRDILGGELVDAEAGRIREEIFAVNREGDLIQAMLFEEMQPLVLDQEPADSALVGEAPDLTDAGEGDHDSNVRTLSNTPAIVVALTEWDQVGPAQDLRLKGCSLAGDVQSRRLAEALRGRLDIREGYDGLEIASTSFVGRVDVGPLRIAIGPKLPAMPLARLLRYAYGLRDVATFEETRAPTIRHGLHDLLIALLAAEVGELLHRGLARHYVPLLEKLESPRGCVLIDQVIRQGGVREARLPCRHFERRADWHLYQVLRAGVEGAARMVEDRDLRRHVHQLWAMFGDVERLPRLYSW